MSGARAACRPYRNTAKQTVQLLISGTAVQTDESADS